MIHSLWIFISFIVLFASAFFWPSGRPKDSKITFKLKGQDNFANPKRKRVKPRKKNPPTLPNTLETATPTTTPPKKKQ
jgi:hypothetical protein